MDTLLNTLMTSALLANFWPTTLTAQMGSNTYHVRQAATENAVELIPEQLKFFSWMADTHPDLEVRRRCEVVVQAWPGTRLMQLYRRGLYTPGLYYTPTSMLPWSVREGYEKAAMQELKMKVNPVFGPEWRRMTKHATKLYVADLRRKGTPEGFIRKQLDAMMEVEICVVISNFHTFKE